MGLLSYYAGLNKVINMMYSINTIKDSGLDVISTGMYLDAAQSEQSFEYMGPIDGLNGVLEGLRNEGAEFSHRVETGAATGHNGAVSGWLEHEVDQSMGFALHGVWDNVVMAGG